MNADGGTFMQEVFARADAFLLGRRTYEIFASYWPKVTDPADPIATALNRLPKHVASKTLKEASWGPAAFVREVPAEVARLKERYPRELQVHGSAGLAQTLIRHDLVDELNLLVFPVVIGSGKRLFGSGAVPASFKLTSTRTTDAGVVIGTYRRAGPLVTGSF